jgi:hypothetical protein
VEIQILPRRLGKHGRLLRQLERMLVGIDCFGCLAPFAMDVPEEHPGTGGDVVIDRMRDELLERVVRILNCVPAAHVRGRQAELCGLGRFRVVVPLRQSNGFLEDLRGVVDEAGVEQTTGPGDRGPLQLPLAALFVRAQKRRRLLDQRRQRYCKALEISESLVRLQDETSPRIEQEQVPLPAAELLEVRKGINRRRARRRARITWFITRATKGVAAASASHLSPLLSTFGEPRRSRRIRRPPACASVSAASSGFQLTCAWREPVTKRTASAGARVRESMDLPWWYRRGKYRQSEE